MLVWVKGRILGIYRDLLDSLVGTCKDRGGGWALEVSRTPVKNEEMGIFFENVVSSIGDLGLPAYVRSK